MAPLSTILFLSSPFMAGLNTVCLRASACERLALESAHPIIVGEILGSDTEYVGLDSLFDT
jgi:hypothetical protein